MKSTQNPTLLAGIGLLGILSLAQTSRTSQVATLTAEQREILSHMSLVYLDDGTGNLVNKTIRITGVNVQIVNGLDGTNGNPLDPDAIASAQTLVNGTGNLIVGYNELGNPNGNERTGSHNIVVGKGNSYSSFGGLVVGHDNRIGAADIPHFGAYSSILGGRDNYARATRCAIVGGLNDFANNDYTVVLGGQNNEAYGDYCSILGGSGNVLASSVDLAVAVGGTGNGTSTNSSVVVGPVTFVD